jgi:NarL family two-component system response regulator LiaR
MSDKIRILIVDDHAVVREGLSALIKTEPDMELVGEAADGGEAVQKAQDLHPDVILLDLVMPRKDGIFAIKELKRLKLPVRILVLTSFAEDELLFPAIKAGALGYMLKDSSARDLLQAIRDVYNGLSSLHPVIARKLVGEYQQEIHDPQTDEALTEREFEIMVLVAQGLPNQEIANRLVLSERTVRTHMTNILSKLHLANRTQVALYAMRRGIIKLQ